MVSILNMCSDICFFKYVTKKAMFYHPQGVVVDKEFDVIVDEIQERSPAFKVIYQRSLPIHKEKYELLKKGAEKRDTAPYNVDPVRILYYTKKNLRLLDLFNRIDKDKSARLDRDEMRKALEVCVDYCVLKGP